MSFVPLRELSNFVFLIFEVSIDNWGRLEGVVSTHLLPLVKKKEYHIRVIITLLKPKTHLGETPT